MTEKESGSMSLVDRSYGSLVIGTLIGTMWLASSREPNIGLRTGIASVGIAMAIFSATNLHEYLHNKKDRAKLAANTLKEITLPSVITGITVGYGIAGAKGAVAGMIMGIAIGGTANFLLNRFYK